MNYAKNLYKLEQEKEALLKQSNIDLLGHFFCFVNIYPIRFMNSTVKGIENSGVRINFEIISVEDSEKNEFYSLDFSTTLQLDKNNQLQFSNNAGTTVKTINSKGIFFIQHYLDLNDKQKKDFLHSIGQYYQRQQDKQDEYSDGVAISSLLTSHIVHYLKSDKNIELSKFIQQINDSVTNIIDEHLSSFVCQTKKEYFEKIDKVHTLNIEEKNNLINNIQSHFYDLVKQSLHIIKREGSYQDEWIMSHNQAVDYFIKTDKNFSKINETYVL